MKKKIFFPQFLMLTLLVLFFTQCASVKNVKIASRNEETVRLWFEEGWNNNRNEELLERCFDPGWRDGNPLLADQLSGYEGMRHLVQNYRAGASEAHFTITHLLADQSKVAVRFEVVATHTGGLFGLPPTGKEFTSIGINIYEMRNGRILTSWQELDLSGLISQIEN